MTNLLQQSHDAMAEELRKKNEELQKMITKETLELAAKAAGYVVWEGSGWQSEYLFTTCSPDPTGKTKGVRWYPDDDDADAFRLQVDLGLKVYQTEGYAHACIETDESERIEIRVPINEDKRKATREAITLCAAEIGRMME